MIEWWESLTVAESVFFGVAIIATVIVFIQIVFIFLGSDTAGDLDLDVDSDIQAEHASGLKFLSIQTISAFFTAWGWIGGGALDMTGSLIFAISIGIAAGLGGSSVIFFIMRWAHKVDQSGTLDFRNAIGQTGTVYIPIPANKEGEGQIEINFQGRFQVLPAVTSNEAELKSQTKVLVVDMDDNNVLIVRPV